VGARAGAGPYLILRDDRAAGLIAALTRCDLEAARLVPSSPAPGYVTVTPAPARERASQLLLVGERHSPRGSGPAFSGDGPSARRLTELLGRPVLETVVTVNLVQGDWDAEEAARTAAALRQVWPGRIIACGSRAATAFGLRDRLVWHDSVAAIPHPSGRNYQWNDPRNVAATAAFLRDALAAR